MDDVKQAITLLAGKIDTMIATQADSNTHLKVLAAKFDIVEERGCTKGELRAEELHEKINDVAKGQSYTKAALAVITTVFSAVLIKLGLK